MGKLLCKCGAGLWDEDPASTPICYLVTDQQEEAHSLSGAELDWAQQIWCCRACGRMHMVVDGKGVWYEPDRDLGAARPWDVCTKCGLGWGCECD